MSDFTETMPDEENGEIALALLALGGCPKCGKAFRRDMKAGTLYLACCEVAYCPFCGKTHTRNCVHHVAFTRWGHWRVGGASLRRKQAAVSPLGADGVTAYSAQEWEAAFGEEWEYFRSLILGSAWGSKRFSEKRFAKTLLTKRLPDALWLWRCQHSVFARDVDDFAARVKSDLKIVTEGLGRLTAQAPIASRSLRVVLPGETAYLSKAFFTPKGERLVLTNWHNHLYAWEVGMLARQEFGLPVQGNFSVRSVTEDAVEVSISSYPHRRKEGADESGLYRCDLKTGEMRRIGGECQSAARFPQTIRKPRPFPQGTDCFVQPNGAQIHFFREDEPPFFTLTLAEAPQGVVLSSDGEHFFVRYPQCVALFRVTAADIAALSGSTVASAGGAASGEG